MSDYRGLSLIAATGVAWRWSGHDVVATRRGERVRVERWLAPCRTCGVDFEVFAKLPAHVRRRYIARGLDAERPASLRYVVPRDRRMPAFELRNCPEHRGRPALDDLV